MPSRLALTKFMAAALCPPLAGNYPTDLGYRHSVLPRKKALRSPLSNLYLLSDALHLILRQLGLAVCLTNANTVSAFSDTIIVIILRGAEKQMRRVHTVTNVTVMAHLKASIKWSIEVFKRNTMNRSVRTSEFSVAALIQWSCPQPTTCGVVFVHANPESLKAHAGDSSKLRHPL